MSKRSAKVIFFSVTLSLFKWSNAVSCFDSCFGQSTGECEVHSDTCTDRCGQTLAGSGNGFPQVFPGLIVDETCESECLWGEFIWSRANANFFTIALPFGCKESYDPERVAENLASNILFEEGTNIFSCVGEFCNLPPLDTGCGANESKAYTVSGDSESVCFISNAGFQGVRSHPFRTLLASGVVRVNTTFLNRCVDLTNDEVTQLSLTRYSSNDITEELDFLTCEDCEASAECDVDADVPVDEEDPQETETPSSQPTRAQTSSPTNLPTQKPTDPETDSPTSSPTFPETDSPSSSPINPETETPTSSPVDSVPENPTDEPTGSPEEDSSEVDEDVIILVLAVGVVLTIVFLSLAVFFLLKKPSRETKRKLEDVELAPMAEVVPGTPKTEAITHPLQTNAWRFENEVSGRVLNVIDEIDDEESQKTAEKLAQEAETRSLD